MALSFTPSSSLRSFVSTLFSTQTFEQRKDKAEQALKTMIIDFLETGNRHLNAEDLFAQGSTIIKDCKEYGVDLTGYAVSLLIYEATLIENHADISLTNQYRELAQALLNLLTDCDLTEVTKSLIGLNAPIEMLVQLIAQGADKGTVLAQLVVALKKGQRRVEQVTELLKQYHPLNAIEQYNFVALFEKLSADYSLDKITRDAVESRQDDLVIQLLLYGADHRNLFPARSHELSLEEVIEEIRLLTSEKKSKENTLTDHLRIALNVLIERLAKVQHAALTKAMLITFIQVGAAFKGLINPPQPVTHSMGRPYQYLLPRARFTRHLR